MSCLYCSKNSPDSVAVGFLAAASGAGYTLYACPDCLRSRQLLRLSEHPDESDGAPRTRVGAPGSAEGGS
jgi:hypothetical protein